MDLTAELLAKAELHCERAGISKARLATIVVNDGKFFDRVAAGGSLTVKTYERFMAFFAASEAAAAEGEQAGEGAIGQRSRPRRRDAKAAPAAA